MALRWVSEPDDASVPVVVPLLAVYPHMVFSWGAAHKCTNTAVQYTSPSVTIACCMSKRELQSVHFPFGVRSGRHHHRHKKLSRFMTLTGLPEDVAALTLAHAARRRRKRPRSASRLDSEARTSPRVPIPPIQVDHDLLVQVVRVKVQTLIRKARLCEQSLQQQEPEANQQHHQRCTAERLERLIPVIEQRWLQDLMSGDGPRYGLDEVVQALLDVVHNESEVDDAGKQKR